MDPVLTPRSSGEGRFQQRTLSAKQEGLAICFSQARSQDSLKLLHCVDYSHFTETTSVILDSPSNEKLAKSPSPLSPPLRKGGSISPAWSSMSTGALPGLEEKSPQFSSTGGVVCVCVCVYFAGSPLWLHPLALLSLHCSFEGFQKQNEMHLRLCYRAASG